MNRIFYLSSLFTLTLAAGLLAWIFSLYLAPYKALHVNNTPITIVEKQTKQGGTVSYIVDYCRFDNNPIVIYHILASKEQDVIVPIMMLRTFGEEGCKKVRVFINLPRTIPEGKWYIETIVEMRVNFVRTIYNKYSTEQFVIIKGD